MNPESDRWNLEIVSWVLELVVSQPFLQAFWLFIGVVAGALIQFGLGRLNVRSQAKNALRVMKVEVALNLAELKKFSEQTSRLVRLVSAGQAKQTDLFISMQGFDYSAVNPLVQQGFFHFMLGPERASEYFAFMRFFNNDSAQKLTSSLQQEHAAGNSIKYLNWVEQKAKELGEQYTKLENAELRRGLYISTK